MSWQGFPRIWLVIGFYLSVVSLIVGCASMKEQVSAIEGCMSDPECSEKMRTAQSLVSDTASTSSDPKVQVIGSALGLGLAYIIGSRFGRKK